MPIHEMSLARQRGRGVLENYPRAVGRRLVSGTHGNGCIRLSDFYVIDGEGDESLVIFDKGSWGRMHKKGITLLRTVDGLTWSEVEQALGIAPDQLEQILLDPVSWGMVTLPGAQVREFSCKTWKTDFSLLVFKLTNRCNLNCLYCYNKGIDEGGNLTEEQGIEIVRKAIDFSKQGLNLVFHGGEPFIVLNLMKQICAFATEYAAKRGKKVYFNVQTNATLLNDEMLDFIDAYRVGIGISLDGPGGLNLLRVDHAGRPTADRVWKGIEKLRTRGHAINIITVITSQNADRLYDLVLEFQRRGIASVKFSPFLKQGYDEHVPQHMAPNPEAIAASFARIIEGIIEGKIHNIEVNDISDMIKRCLSWGEPSMCHRVDPCGAGKDMLAVYPSGDVYACDCLAHEKFRLGRLDGTNALPDIVRGPIIDVLSARHPARLEPCANCALATICGGTQTCRAFWSNGDMHTVDATECYVNQKTLLRLLWRLTESRQLVEYFLRRGRPVLARALDHIES